uniref:Uncharacterized protein n=1 Tax=Rhizophora mucronata TaxID=61149 RepID=A0A2P2PDX7_RHIMU
MLYLSTYLNKYAFQNLCDERHIAIRYLQYNYILLTKLLNDS